MNERLDTLRTGCGRRAMVSLLLGAATWPAPARAAEPVDAAAAALVETMQQARRSAGFEARFSLLRAAPPGAAAEPVKLAIVGQFDDLHRRLRIRGIAPARVRDQLILAEQGADGRIVAQAFGSTGAAGPVDPQARVFDTDLVLWDLFAPWWQWPSATIVGSDHVAGRDCTLLRMRSPAPAAAGVAREVVGCVDPANALSMRTQWFDGRHAPLRSVNVTQWFHQASGLGAARKFTLAHGDALTEVEIYAGDPNYQVTAETFAAPPAAPVDAKRP